jgi:glycine/D-amino acid oxidase-like deaminating enzyme
MNKPDFLVVGAGIFGLSSAIALRQRGHRVTLLNPGQIPHPLAASTDISKIVRMEYGTDREYMDMAEQAMEGWRDWNDLFGETLYHEVGFWLACRKSMAHPSQAFEQASYENLLAKGYQPQRLPEAEGAPVSDRFPAFADGVYRDGFFQPQAGYAEASKTLVTLAKYARQLGVTVQEGQRVVEILKTQNRARGVKTEVGAVFEAGQVVICAGNFSPFLIPELKPYFRITGHPVFHLRPSEPELFKQNQFPVFGADIANTGWYGFPLHPSEKVVKIANHGTGLELDPALDERLVYPADEAKLRAFLRESLPALADDPIVYTRRCLYTDTLDGHFWISPHPEIKGLTIGTGGSGHGLKMGPVIGEMIATTAEGGRHRWSARYRWRHLEADTVAAEEARNKTEM